MALMRNGKIAILATAREAVGIVWASRGAHIALSYIALLPFTVMAALGWLDPIIMVERGGPMTVLPPGFWPAFLLTLVWAWGWCAVCIIFWLRLYLTGSNHYLHVTPKQLATMWLKMLGYFLALVAMMVGAALIVSSLISALLVPFRNSAGIMKPIAMVLMVAAVAALIVFLVTLALRVTLKFVGLTVGEDVSLRQSWTAMREHTLSLFLTLMLVSLPLEMISELAGEAIVTLIQGSPFGHHTGPLSAASYLGLLILSPLTFAPTALQLAVAAIYYWHLRPQPGHQVDVSV